MKTILIIMTFLFLFVSYGNNQNDCSSAKLTDDFGPQRLVIIKGKMTILNHPQLNKTPHSFGTIIFQKVGCKSCYVGAKADINGNYEIIVGDGKYKIIARNPSSPEFDMLAPEQKRFITTRSENFPNQVFIFDVKIKLPE